MSSAKFTAPSLDEALRQARELLGPQAEVLAARRRSRLLGLLPSQVEVEARVASRDAEKERESALLQSLANEIARLGEAVQALQRGPEHTPQPPLARLLQRAEVPQQLIGELLWAAARRALVPAPSALEDKPEHRAALAEAISRRLGSCVALDPTAAHRPYVCVFVGPTGAGKTTTIAKLAAQFALERRLAVGLLTLDTFRIAAIEQLRVFAGIARLPMRVVERASQAARGLYSLRHCRLVLVDTAGRSPGRAAHLGELRALTASLKPDECHLVLDLGARESKLRRISEQFKPVGCNRLTVTKLDEVEAFGGLLAMAEQTGLPFSYLTYGQRVPDDLCPANSGLLTSLVMRGSSAAPWAGVEA